MSNSYKEYASKEYVHSVVVSREDIEQIVADAKTYTDEQIDGLADSYATAEQGAKADTALQSVKIGGIEFTKDNNEIDIPNFARELALHSEGELLPAWYDNMTVNWGHDRNNMTGLIIGHEVFPDSDTERKPIWQHTFIGDEGVRVDYNYEADGNGTQEWSQFCHRGIALASNDIEYWLEFPHKDGTMALDSDVAAAKQEAIDAASILTSPNGTKYRLTVSDDGNLSATPITTE